MDTALSFPLGSQFDTRKTVPKAQDSGAQWTSLIICVATGLLVKDFVSLKVSVEAIGRPDVAILR